MTWELVYTKQAQKDASKLGSVAISHWQPDEGASQSDHTGKITLQFVIPSGNGTKMFKSGKHVFNHMPQLV